MMLCDDISSNLPQPHGQSRCPADGMQIGLKTGELLESAASDQMAIAFKSNDCLKSIPTSTDQGNWQTNNAEPRTRHVEFATGVQCVDADSKLRMEQVMCSSDVLHEGRCIKRIADYTNQQHPSYSATKKIKLDEHLVSVDPIQEYWKKGALCYRSRELSAEASDYGNKEATKCPKEELSQRVNRLDSTILHNEMALAKLRSTLENLEDSLARSDKDDRDLENEAGGGKEELKPQLSCLEQVLLENRRRAEASHSFLDKMKSLSGSFLYQQPCDTAVYHENKQKFMTFKKRLVAYLKNRDETQQLRSEKLNEHWNQLYGVWKKKMETVESGQKQRSKKLREYFDRIFPEMQKQEEEKIQRCCSSVLKLNLSHEQKCNVNEACDKMDVETEVMKKLRSLAAHPPPLLDSRSRRLCFLNENGIVEDPEQINNISVLKCSFWTDHEREIFTEKYVRNPKKFGLIASLLENKSVQDCVQFYYLTKKEVGYKKLQRQKYTRKLKIRAAANNMKEEKTEDRHFLIEPCEQFLSSGNVPNISCEQKNSSKMEPSKETTQLSAVESYVEPAVDLVLSSLPERPASCLPSTSMDSSLAGANKSFEKIVATDASLKVSDQRIQVNDLGHAPDAQVPEEAEGVDEMPNSDYVKAAADDDNESVATLSADEAAGHCPDDDSPVERTPSKPLRAAEKVQNALRMNVQAPTLESFRAEVDCDEVPRSQRFLATTAAPVNLDESQHSLSERGERKTHSATSAASPLLGLNPRNEFQGWIRSSVKDIDERFRTMPELQTMATTSTQGRSQQGCNLSLGDRGNDGRVAMRVAELSSFSRNAGSPTRIRDLIHAAIEKNLQAIDNKQDMVTSSRNDSKQFRPSSNLNYKSPSVSALDVENSEVQDLSMRTSRCISTSKMTAIPAGKPISQQPSLHQFPKVDSPYHPRPAHANHSDPRAGSLLDLAYAAEYEHMKRMEREQQKAVAERDGSFRRFEAPLTGEIYGLKPMPQTWRQREEPIHKGSIMAGTPISNAHYRIQTARQVSDACIEGLAMHPSAVAHNIGVQSEPVSWQRPSYPQFVPQISSEHNKLLHNDFLTAQQIRTMQESSLHGDGREQQHPQSYHPYQDVPSRVSHVGQYDARAADVYQQLRTAPVVQSFSNTDTSLYHRPQLPVGQYPDEVTQPTGQRLLPGSWQGGSSHIVMPAFRNSPSEADRDRFPVAVQANRNPAAAANVKSVPFLPGKPDPLGWQKISAAELIEKIINNQISKSDGEDKIQPSNILSRIDDISPSSYDDSVFAHVPVALRSSHNSNEQVIPKTGSKSAAPDKTVASSGRTSEKGSIPNAAIHDQGFILDAQVHRRDAELQVSARGCISGTAAPNKLANPSSGMEWNKAIPLSAANINSEDVSYYSQQLKRPTTIGESLDAIVESVARNRSYKSLVGDNQMAMRTFIADSDSVQQVSLHQRGFAPEAGVQSHSSLPKPASFEKAEKFDSDELKSKEDPEGAAKDGSSSSRLFSWKTKLLREHQKQQVENENPCQTIQKSTEVDTKMNDRHPYQLPSSEKPSKANDVEGSSVVQSDDAGYLASRMSSPDDVHSSSRASSAADDHLSTIAATHQMMSTLLSNRSGRQPGQSVPPSSAAGAGPFQPDPPSLLKPAASKDNAVDESVVPEQCEQQASSPVAAGPDSPNSDSRESDQPGRLIIRMDSAED